MKNLRLALVATTLLAAGAAQAQDFHPGLQLTVSQPQGDLGDKDQVDMKTGYGAGIHVMIDLKGGHALVPRLDYTMYKNSQDVAPGISVDTKVNILMLGLDYNYFISHKANQGFYLDAGLGYGSAKFEAGAMGVSFSDTPNAVYVAAGLGYMFNPNVGAELRYTSAKYEPEFAGTKMSATCPAINASVVFRF